MAEILVIGGTRFIGRHLVEACLDAGYDVTVFNRGKHANPFAEHETVEHIKGDRTSGAMLEDAANAVEPTYVVDCVAYHPGEVRMATTVFDDVEGYLYISSGAVYEPNTIPKREDETPLESCSDAEAVDETPATYGARKAEGDRAVFEAAQEGVRALSVRPTIVYGSYDYTGRFEYWVEQVRTQDQILIPGDGTNIHHLVHVENVASAILTVLEEGDAGEAYNVGDRSIMTLAGVIKAIAAELDQEVELVTTSDRELEAGGLSLTDFPLYNPTPHLLSTEKLTSLGWDPISPEDAVAEAVSGPVSPERDPGPSPAEIEEMLESIVE